MKSVYAVFKNSGKLLMVFNDRADAEEMAFSLQEDMAYYWYCLDIHMGKTNEQFFENERRINNNRKKKRRQTLNAHLLLSGLLVEAFTVRETILFE